jgi:CBS domain containing-hemolysin-like protein
MNPIALLVALTLVAINGLFVAVEFAFTASRRATIEDLAAEGSRRARAALAAMNDTAFTFAGAQLGINAASLGLGYVAEPALAAGLQPLFGLAPISEGAAHTIALVFGLLIATLLHMIVGEMAPKNAVIANPERVALRLAIPFRVYSMVLGPLIKGLTSTASAILRLLGESPIQRIETTHTAEDIAVMIRAVGEEGLLAGLPHRLLTGAINFSDRDVSGVMVPRPDVIALPDSASLAEVEQTVVKEGFSRIPVYREDLDDVLGFVHAKDLLQIETGDRDRAIPVELIRPMLVVPETAHIGPLLNQMRRSRTQIALVVDEHGGAAGVVTIEDLAEELVGEIRDEYDQDEHGLTRIGDDWYVASGRVRTELVSDLIGVDLPEGEYETLGGFLMDILGRIPHRGDRLDMKGWILRVRRMDGRRVDEVDLVRVG